MMLILLIYVNVSFLVCCNILKTFIKLHFKFIWFKLFCDEDETANKPTKALPSKLFEDGTWNTMKSGNSNSSSVPSKNMNTEADIITHHNTWKSDDNITKSAKQEMTSSAAKKEETSQPHSDDRLDQQCYETYINQYHRKFNLHKLKRQWRLIAAMVDRFMLIVFSLVTIVACIAVFAQSRFN